MEIGVLPEQEKNETDDVSFLEGIWNKIETGVKAVDFTDHVDYTDPLGWETLGQRWGEKTIGKKWREGQMQDVWNAVPEAWRPNITKAAMATAESVGTAWQGARTVDNWFNPLDVAAAGTARSIELAALPFEGLAQLTSAGTGLDIELSRVVADFIPVGGIAKRGAQLARRASLAKHLNKVDDLVKAGNLTEARKYVETNLPGSNIMFNTGGVDLVSKFNDAKRRGMVEEMTTIFNQMNDVERNRLDMQLRGIQHKLNPKFTQGYVEPNLQEVANIKQHIVDYKVAGKGKSFNWFAFHGKLTSPQQRITSVVVSTNPQAAIGSSWADYTKQLQKNFLALYDTNLVRKKGYIIDVDHGLTLVQSMPIYHGLVPGSNMYNTVQKRILAKGYKPGNAADNLTALDRSVHNLKSAYFNKLHGKHGLNFFTMDVLKKFEAGPNWTQAQADAYRLKMLDLYLKQVDEGQKIIAEAQKAYHYLHTNDTLIPEQIVEALTDIITDNSGGIVKKYTSRQLREILEDIDKAYPDALKFDLEDRIEILRKEILEVEKLGKSANPRLKILERRYKKLVREYTKKKF